MLGFTFTKSPTVNKHVSIVTSKIRSRTWALRKLRRSGFTTEELITFYKASIRPVAEYIAPVFHPLTPDFLSEGLERQQTLALKNIFGVGMSANKMREMAKLETLWDRWEMATLKLAKKAVENERFSDWFPRRNSRQTRKNRPFIEKTARTNSRKTLR